MLEQRTRQNQREADRDVQERLYPIVAQESLSLRGFSEVGHNRDREKDSGPRPQRQHPEKPRYQRYDRKHDRAKENLGMLDHLSLRS